MPEYYSFFEPIKTDFLLLTFLFLPAYQYIPLLAEKTYLSLVHPYLQDIRSILRLSAN